MYMDLPKLYALILVSVSNEVDIHSCLLRTSPLLSLTSCKVLYKHHCQQMQQTFFLRKKDKLSAREKVYAVRLRPPNCSLH